MFYRRHAWQSPVFFCCSLSPCVDSPTFVQLFIEEQKKRKKKERKPCLPTPPLFFVITKEQIHIKHTQGAAAVIAVSTVLLWVAGGDKISHRDIYIFFRITSSLTHGQVEAGHILEKRYFSCNKHDASSSFSFFFNHYSLCLLQHVMFWQKAVHQLHSLSVSTDKLTHIQIEVKTFLI